jgi:hypothetical protein
MNIARLQAAREESPFPEDGQRESRGPTRQVERRLCSLKKPETGDFTDLTGQVGYDRMHPCLRGAGGSGEEP